MQLKLKPYTENTHPVCGFLVRGKQINRWFSELQASQLTYDDVTIYPVPDTLANSVWGCYVELKSSVHDILQGNKEYCLKRSDTLIIPEKSVLFPDLKNAELDDLFKPNKHIFHPEFGLLELDKPIDLAASISLPIEKEVKVFAPEDTVERPSAIHVFQLKPIEAEDILSEMTSNAPVKKQLSNKPLNFGEKVQLKTFKYLFKPGESSSDGTGDIGDSRLGKFMPSKFGSGSKIGEKMAKKLEDLEQRNKKELDRLMDMFDENPENALHYALPLDSLPGRGLDLPGDFKLSKLWANLGLNLMPSGSGGSLSIEGDAFNTLREKYIKAANDLVAKGDFQKAAFIYMKLLKDYYQAAQTLEDGGLFKEAAAVYDKHLKNKEKAAECYEKALMFDKAISLYEELEQLEKVGDLYRSMKKHDYAKRYYEKALDRIVYKHQFVKAAKLSKEKLGDFNRGQRLLLDGWRLKKDAYNCLSFYFAEFKDDKKLLKELDNVYSEQFEFKDHESFILLVRNLYKQKKTISKELRDMGYSIVSDRAKTNPDFVSQLKGFNKNDHEFVKDTIRYKTGVKSKSVGE